MASPSGDEVSGCKAGRIHDDSNLGNIKNPNTVNKVSDIFNMEKYKKKISANNINTLCDFCKRQGVAISASLYCQQCESLCEECCKRHRTQDLTKEHVLITIDKNEIQLKATLQMCEICIFNRKSVAAALFCPQCDNEFICNECGQNQYAQKSTRSHFLSDIGNYVDPTIENSPLERGERMCELCTFKGESVAAERFFPQCDDELLCNDCGNNHNAQKSTQSHVLSEVANYVDQSNENVPTKRCDRMCEPCTFNGKSVVAALFCPQCDSEFLCNECGPNYNAHKSTRSHGLSDIGNYVDPTIANSPLERGERMCELCTFKGESVAAEWFCPQCDNGLLCNDCGKNHNAQKSTHSHVLSEVANYVDQSNENVPTKRCDRMCEPCTFN
ncbi:hypothetical protein DPMN_169751 [Dreissena polymorpha]|uniref:Uncharacterized protein n=1 Tax=Dreissena polymorpha TaxID=45954 RepID=A0A9D4DUY5_DREPO|nr:hypothetical protein DPMN_169751 [Dreissena polymorpha]